MQTKYDYLTHRQLIKEVKFALNSKKESEYCDLLQELLSRFTNLVK